MAKIILAIDGSEHSERAFHFYLKNIHREDNELLLIHALEYPYLPGSPYVRNDIVKEMFDKTKADGTKVDHKFQELCQQNKVKFRVFTEFSNPGEYIVKNAQEQDARMIVMGTRGMGTIRRTILGSVSDFVVHHAHCPVMIARH